MKLCGIAASQGARRVGQINLPCSMHISEELMRVSVGIEDADDIIKDFEQALKVFD